MLTAVLYGLATAIPIAVGAAIGLRWDLPNPILATLMAFGAGTMIAAVSTELFEPAFTQAGTGVAAVALFSGTAVYVVADRLVETKLGSTAIGPALMIGVFLDGVPENTALGVSLTAGGSLVLVVAIAVGNVPEAVSGASLMRREHDASGRSALAMWTFTAVVLVAVTVGGYAMADAIPTTVISVVQAFAGGATLGVLANSLMPEAYREGGWWVGLATAAGFLLAFVLG
ncbi:MULTISPECIES: ZIP family metal transporter [Gordonia]|uniref:ZIP family metal transporter n=1 Tax=Gordonia TaxID=2053 RepID=UPI0010F47A87|nr:MULTISPECIES: ZIP family metal transporter [unclassified Gordonia (in: high G+C Gram-positive bacteria)]